MATTNPVLLASLRQRGLFPAEPARRQAPATAEALNIETALRDIGTPERDILNFMRWLRTQPQARQVVGTGNYWGTLPASRLTGGNAPFDHMVDDMWTSLQGEAWFQGVMNAVGAYNAGPVGNQFVEDLVLTAIRNGVMKAGGIAPVVATISTEAPSRDATINTPYVNSIPPSAQPAYPGNLELEREIEIATRWNALAMVDKANHRFEGLGGHLATFQSEATLIEVGQNHFFRGNDQVFFHGHASPGMYARDFLLGRWTKKHLDHFRREASLEGLPSYPHPYRLDDYWQFPTVSMGLGPIGAIYQGSYNRYLENRGIVEPNTTGRVWAFLGDGEMDEVESRGALQLAAREKLDNVVFVVSANLQRLDSNVRPNGHIIQELEAFFRGAGWNVIKVVWGGKWDQLFQNDTTGELARRVEAVPDGDWQNYLVQDGAFIRNHLFNTPTLQAMVANLDDEAIKQLIRDRGGHDSQKVHAAYDAATKTTGKPTVIIAQTIKGHDTPIEGIMKTHQEKKFTKEQMIALAKKWSLPFTEADFENGNPYFQFPDESEALAYMKARRAEKGGYLPARNGEPTEPLKIPADGTLIDIAKNGTAKVGEEKRVPTVKEYVDLILTPAATPPVATEEKAKGRQGQVSTTQTLVDLMRKWMGDSEIGKYIVPIIPDEGRTFGVEAIYGKGVYDPEGESYTPADSKAGLMAYKVKKDGQTVQAGINEAGAMANFVAAATSYATHGIPTIPIYMFYSMFGLQRTGDQWWLNGDARGRGFLVGGTAGRTTLNGEGLQHEDGHSLLMAHAIPNMKSYDASFGYEQAVIMEDGLKRMHGENPEDIFYYLTAYNENYLQAPMPLREGVKEGILKGLYKFADGEELRPEMAERSSTAPRISLLGSGPLMQEVLKAQKILAEQYGVIADVFSATSYSELAREAEAVEYANSEDPNSPPQESYVSQMLGDTPVIAVTDFVKAVPDLIAKHIKGKMVSLGTDGYGLSDTRADLRDHFGIDHRYIVYHALRQLKMEGKVALNLDEVRATHNVRKKPNAQVDPRTLARRNHVRSGGLAPAHRAGELTRMIRARA